MSFASGERGGKKREGREGKEERKKKKKKKKTHQRECRGVERKRHEERGGKKVANTYKPSQ